MRTLDFVLRSWNIEEIIAERIGGVTPISLGGLSKEHVTLNYCYLPCSAWLKQGKYFIFL